ncbi:MAG TPA: Ig-like domain-containing protein [Gemmatimonadales bacterium]|nr:Ig-like domain-containing protein [Gemmatimonadales bacterium]
MLGILVGFASACGESPSDPLPSAAGIRIDPADSIVRMGNTTALRATYIAESGHPIPGGGFSWATDNPASASVSPAGLVTALEPGDVRISVTGAGFSAVHGMLVVDSQIVARVDLHASPFGIAIAGSTAYLTLPLADSVRVVNTTTAAVVGSIATGGAPTTVAFNPAGTRAYVANQEGTLGVIDPATHTVTGSVPVPGTPYAVVVSGDGATIWISAVNNNTLYAVDAMTLTVTGSGSTPTFAEGLARHPTIARLYSGALGAFIGDVNLYEIDAGTLDSLRGWVISGTASNVAVAPDGSRLFVADQGGSLNVINLASGAAQPPIPLLGSASGIAISPDGSKLAISTTVGWVEEYNLATLAQSRYVWVGGTPRGLAYRPDGTRLLVANEAGWVDFIR